VLTDPTPDARPLPPRGARTVVVIVNYKTPDLVVRLLTSLGASEPLPTGVVVVDNASGDGSLDALRAFARGNVLRDRLQIVASPVNAGFAGGNNVGIEHARRVWPDAGAFFLLNPDTVVQADTIRSLEEVLEHNPRAAIVGSQIHDAGGQPECSAHRGDGPSAQLVGVASLRVVERLTRACVARVVDPGRPSRCDWVSGAAMLVRAKALADVGLMDDGFFLYFEETDLCRRVRRAGWKVWLAPASRVTHWEGSSTGIARGRRPAYWFRSRRRYFVKHFGLLGLVAADAAWVVGYGLRMLSVLVGGARRSPLPPRFASDLLLGDLVAILHGRQHGQ
jgi:GT2 family glycosyltransferase